MYMNVNIIYKILSSNHDPNTYAYTYIYSINKSKSNNSSDSLYIFPATKMVK